MKVMIFTRRMNRDYFEPVFVSDWLVRDDNKGDITSRRERWFQ